MMKKSKTSNIEKEIYSKYAKCIYCIVNSNGSILDKKKIKTEFVCLDKDGMVYIKPVDPDTADACFAELYPLDIIYKSYDSYIEGVFSSEQTAIETTKEWFKQEKIEEIARLEKKIKSLKKELS